MLLVFAHAGDQIARELIASWPDARLVVPRDLSAPGWRHFPVGGGDDTIGLGDAVVRASAVKGALTRIAAVGPDDLPHIGQEDRAYVAGEMTAFLLSFLTALGCPVINRPSASSLMGPGWSPHRWRAAAAAARIEIAEPGAGSLVTVVGAECLGAASPSVADRALTLARAARVEFLPVRMTDDARFAAAEPWAPLAPAVAAAVHAMLRAPALEAAS